MAQLRRSLQGALPGPHPHPPGPFAKAFGCRLPLQEPTPPAVRTASPWPSLPWPGAHHHPLSPMRAQPPEPQCFASGLGSPPGARPEVRVSARVTWESEWVYPLYLLSPRPGEGRLQAPPSCRSPTAHSSHPGRGGALGCCALGAPREKTDRPCSEGSRRPPRALGPTHSSTQPGQKPDTRPGHCSSLLLGQVSRFQSSRLNTNTQASVRFCVRRGRCGR